MDSNVRKILLKKIFYDLTAEEEAYIAKWLKDNPKDYKQIKAFPGGKDILNRLNIEVEVNAEESYKEFEHRIGFVARKRNFRRWGLAAASLIILFSLGILTVYFSSDNKSVSSINELSENIQRADTKKVKLVLSDGEQLILSEKIDSSYLKKDNILICNDSAVIKYGDNTDYNKIKYNTIDVPKGAEYNFYLSDGTHVFLNSETKITFPISFIGERREVRISGEAFFYVAENKAKPFIVKTKFADVKVTGTRFNVKAYPDDEVMQTTLVKGGVNVYYGKKKTEWVGIRPNQQAEVTHNKEIRVREVNTYNYTAWLRSEFVFEDMPLQDIMKILSRWYDIQVFYQNESVKELRFSGKFNKYESIEPFLRMLKYSKRVGCVTNKKTIILKEK